MKTPSRFHRVVMFTFAAVFAAASAFAEGEELIANGSFEGGDTSQLDTNKAASFDSLSGGWAGEASGWAQAGTWYPSSPGAKDGTAAAWMQKGSSVISQNVTVVQGGLYKVQFYALARSSSIKDLDLLAQIDPGTDDEQTVVPRTKISSYSAWTLLSGEVPLKAGNHVFAIFGKQDDTANRCAAVDCVSITHVPGTRLADGGTVEYRVTVTNVTGGAVMTDSNGESSEHSLVAWVASGSSYGVTVADAENRRVGWMNLPTDATKGERGLSVTMPSITKGWDVRVEHFSPTHVWTGGAGTSNWETPENWDVSSAPGEGSVVYVPAGAAADAVNSVTVSAPFNVAALHVGAALDEPGQVTLTFSHREENNVSGNVHAYPRATITHTGLPTTANKISDECYRVALVAGGDFSLDAEAAIDVTSRGYTGSKGPGYGKNTASHGGRLGSDYGSCYGSLSCPTNHGSGADRSRCGGGAVRVAAQGALLVNGTIAADGQWISGEYTSGAGGSVWLSGATLEGTGTVSANGAKAYYGYSGSGGRVAVHLSQPTDFSVCTVKFLAHGGETVSTGHGGPGPAGTIYLESAGKSTVIVDNANLSYHNNGTSSGFAEFSSTDGSDHFDTLIVRNNAGVKFLPGETYTFSGSLLFNDGEKYRSKIYCSPDVTFELAGSAECVITGTNSWPSLRCTVPGKVIRFGTSALDAFPVLGSSKVEFKGTAEQPITLAGVDDGTWRLALGPQVRQEIRHVVVSGSDASGGLAGMAYASAAGAVENRNWRFAALPDVGAAVQWTGAVSGDWNDACNWAPERVPVETDVVTVPGMAPNMPAITTHDVTVAALTVAAGASLYLESLNLTVTGDLRVAGALTAHYREGIFVGGNLDFTGATVTPAEMTITLTGGAAQTVEFADLTVHHVVVRKTGGSVTFPSGFTCADLDLRETGNLVFRFAAGETVTCADFRVDGVTLASTEERTKWLLDIRSSATANGITVSDSKAVGLAVYADSSSREQPGREGSCERWTFGALAQAWTGLAGDGKWETAENWSPAVVPGPTSRVVIAVASASVTASDAASVQNLVLGDGSAAVSLRLDSTFSADDGVEVMNRATLTANKPMTVTGNMSVREGGTLTHTALPAKSSKITDGVYAVNVTCGGTFTVEAGAEVNVVGKGYPTGLGPGYASSHGAHGGTLDADKSYGSAICPTNHGSASNFKPGGGVVRITAGEDVCVNGTITAEGDFRTGEYNGAAGGSVWLTCARLTGSGAVSVNGGFATYGWSGAGGRLAVHLTRAADFSDWHGKLTANGGESGGPTQYGPHGPAGTIYKQTVGGSRTNATLIVDNAGRVSARDDGWTELDAESGIDVIGTVVVTNNARVHVKPDATLDVHGDWLARGGRLRLEDGARVRFAGKGEHRICGEHEFCDVTCEEPGATLLFGTEAGDCFKVAAGHTLTVTGSEDEHVVLTPAVPGEIWKVQLAVGGFAEISYATVDHSDASEGIAIMTKNSTDGLYNDNWMFPKPMSPGDPVTWTGETDSDWNKTSNWVDKYNDHRTPIPDDKIVVPAGCAHWPVIPSTYSYWGLVVDTNATLTVAGGPVSITNELRVAGTLVFSGHQTLEVSAQAASFADATVVPGEGTVRILDGVETFDPGNCNFCRVEISRAGGSFVLTDGLKARFFEVRATDESTLTFAAGKTIEADTVVCCCNAAEKYLTLQSSAANEKWFLKSPRISYMTGVRVSDSTATDAKAVASLSVNVRESNENWVFDNGVSEWVGGASGKFDVAENWYPAGVPGATNDVILRGAAAITADGDVSVRTLTLAPDEFKGSLTVNGVLTAAGDVVVGTNATLILTTAQEFNEIGGDLVVQAGGMVTHPALAGSANTLADSQLGAKVIVRAKNVIVEKDGKIDVSDKGYAVTKGPAAGGTRLDADGNSYSVGAGHGGIHNHTYYGRAVTDAHPVLTDYRAYGSMFEPMTHGSGGALESASGGGVIRLDVAGDITVDGAISANGKSGYDYGYGGAGGSVWITVAGALRGSGVVSANGADGRYDGTACGGRVAVYMGRNELARGKITADGSAVNYAYARQMSQSPGTVLLKLNGESVYSLVLDYTDFNSLAGSIKSEFMSDTYLVQNATPIPTDEDLDKLPLFKQVSVTCGNLSVLSLLRDLKLTT